MKLLPATWSRIPIAFRRTAPARKVSRVGARCGKQIGRATRRKSEVLHLFPVRLPLPREPHLLSRFIGCNESLARKSVHTVSYSTVAAKPRARLSASVPAIISMRCSGPGGQADQEKTDKLGYRCLAAGFRQRTTACEWCSVLRTRPNLCALRTAY